MSMRVDGHDRALSLAVSALPRHRWGPADIGCLGNPDFVNTTSSRGSDVRAVSTTAST